MWQKLLHSVVLRKFLYMALGFIAVALLLLVVYFLFLDFLGTDNGGNLVSVSVVCAKQDIPAGLVLTDDILLDYICVKKIKHSDVTTNALVLGRWPVSRGLILLRNIFVPQRGEVEVPQSVLEAFRGIQVLQDLGVNTQLESRHFTRTVQLDGERKLKLPLGSDGMGVVNGMQFGDIVDIWFFNREIGETYKLCTNVLVLDVQDGEVVIRVSEELLEVLITAKGLGELTIVKVS